MTKAKAKTTVSSDKTANFFANTAKKIDDTKKSAELKEQASAVKVNNSFYTVNMYKHDRKLDKTVLNKTFVLEVAIMYACIQVDSVAIEDLALLTTQVLKFDVRYSADKKAESRFRSHIKSNHIEKKERAKKKATCSYNKLSDSVEFSKDFIKLCRTTDKEYIEKTMTSLKEVLKVK